MSTQNETDFISLTYMTTRFNEGNGLSEPRQ